VNGKSPKSAKPLGKFLGVSSDPNGSRTRVFGVKGRCPRPLDDGVFTEKKMSRLGNQDGRLGLEVCNAVLVSHEGIEPSTHGLKVRCSTI
jgi:hypothetical protein